MDSDNIDVNENRKTGFRAFICHLLKKDLDVLRFPSNLKQGDITSVFNKWMKDYKRNYRPISFLQFIFKIFEKFTFKKIASFLDKFFSKFQNG